MLSRLKIFPPGPFALLIPTICFESGRFSMQQQKTKLSWVTILVIVLFVFLAFLISLLASPGKVKAGDGTIGSWQQDASKERPLTPAGSLIIDRNTRQAAVGSLA